jgi:GT2 family glycosyltransferase
MSSVPVSVIVVNYNRADALLECLDSVMSQSAAPAEIIVVDNGSGDGSVKAARERFGDKVRMVELAENLGFAGGNNAGIKQAQSEWIALINNDAPTRTSGWWPAGSSGPTAATCSTTPGWDCGPTA